MVPVVAELLAVEPVAVEPMSVEPVVMEPVVEDLEPVVESLVEPAPKPAEHKAPCRVMFIICDDGHA